jgi:hypothetical protein
MTAKYLSKETAIRDITETTLAVHDRFPPVKSLQITSPARPSGWVKR